MNNLVKIRMGIIRSNSCHEERETTFAKTILGIIRNNPKITRKHWRNNSGLTEKQFRGNTFFCLEIELFKTDIGSLSTLMLDMKAHSSVMVLSWLCHDSVIVLSWFRHGSFMVPSWLRHCFVIVLRQGSISWSWSSLYKHQVINIILMYDMTISCSYSTHK